MPKNLYITNPDRTDQYGNPTRAPEGSVAQTSGAGQDGFDPYPNRRMGDGTAYQTTQGSNGGSNGSGNNGSGPQTSNLPGWNYGGTGFQTPQGGGGWSYEGMGFQAPTRAAAPNWAGPKSSVPPPPPPPPPPIGPAPDFQGIAGGIGQATQGPQYNFQGQDFLNQMEAFGSDWLTNYNPYGSQLLTAGRAAMDERLAKQAQDSTRGLEELMASRGLVGSSVETDGYISNQEALRRQQAQEEATLLEMIANYELLGRQGAGNFGLGLTDAQQRQSMDQFTADRQTSRDLEDDRRWRTGTNLDAARLTEDSMQGRRGLDLTERGQTDQMAMDRARLEREDDQISLRAHEIQLNALLRGQEMDLQSAIAQAQNEIQRNMLSQGESQFWRDFSFRTEAERARNELDRERMGQDESQYRRTYDADQFWREVQRDLEIDRLLRGA